LFLFCLACFFIAFPGASQQVESQNTQELPKKVHACRKQMHCPKKCDLMRGGGGGGVPFLVVSMDGKNKKQKPHRPQKKEKIPKDLLKKNTHPPT
jgi:hypothetical protein